ncbi:MAG: hypothetical protein RSF40_01360 [Oscillospiraceae bacterium]
MFNPEQKTAFIDYAMASTLSPKNGSREADWVNLFNRLEEVEQDQEKDFSQFTYKEMLDSLPLILRKTVNYQRQTISSLRGYLTWSIENKCSLDSENRLIGLTPSDVDFSKSYAMCMVKDEEQLSEYLDVVLADLNDDSGDNMYRTMLHLVFNGVQFNDVFNLKLDQVNFENKTLTYGNNIIALSDKCCELIAYVRDMDVIASSQGGTAKRTKKGIKDAVTREREIVKNGYILENTSDDRSKMKNTAITVVSTKFATLKQHLEYPIAITFTSLWRSGVFYRAYQIELETGEISLQELGDGEDYKLEYAAWKKAFSL